MTNKDVNTELSQYLISRQDQIAKLLKKDILIVVILKKILSNWQVFNLGFVDKIKDPYTDKAYKKRCSIIQAYKDNDKSFMLTQLPKIQ